MQNIVRELPDRQTGKPAASGANELIDLRFRQLLGAQEWASLPDAVRRRFGKRLGVGHSANYAGQVLSCRMNISGWILAQACRLIGAPLPLEREGGVAAIVSVTEDGVSGGQVWTRVYARKRGFPQVIHSAKRFAGPTGLEEYLGGGFGIALCVSAIEGGIRFSSDHYFLQLGRIRLRMPRWLAPGVLTIDHADCGGGSFTFTLALRHRLLGEVMHQHSRFCDQSDNQGGPAHD
ncbi:DUF4166 domain-containing protein [Novosphingobium sp. 1Y9A]|uniref:DUF4166 domain-containing protein n=1 Tax=Novosphingobium jiangmenense TaxID=2791981 RepID=A0ABS0HDP7_9SPHN|nr:DUF4166 domain-containing protein [Novosphingobium jiangmenense]